MSRAVRMGMHSDFDYWGRDLQRVPAAIDEQTGGAERKRERGPSHGQTVGACLLFIALLTFYAGWVGGLGLVDFAVFEALFLVSCFRLVWHLFYWRHRQHRISAALCAFSIGLAVFLSVENRIPPRW